jgi:hypothetical protein
VYSSKYASGKVVAYSFNNSSVLILIESFDHGNLPESTSSFICLASFELISSLILPTKSLYLTFNSSGIFNHRLFNSASISSFLCL